jgi:hypothetical protein
MCVGWLATDRIRRSATSSSVLVTGQVISNMALRVRASKARDEWQE